MRSTNTCKIHPHQMKKKIVKNTDTAPTFTLKKKSKIPIKH